jgi:hypothetical protein
MSKPGADPSSGISLGDALILPKRHPACRRRANDDNHAIQKADEWVASIPELIEEETWLIIKAGARGIRPKKIK